MKPEFRDWVELVRALSWPVTLIAAFTIFREPISKFVANLGQRVKKFSIFEFELELSSVPEFTPVWTTPSLTDVRQPSASSEFTSYAYALIQQIRDDTACDYAIIDLDTGHSWLTSRLFIFAVLLQRMRNLQCFVFVETLGHIRRRFIGMASPDAVRWALALRYPWLEQAFATSYGQVGNIQIFSSSGALDTGIATQVFQNYLTNIQQSVAPTTDVEEWVPLQSQASTWEHAKWIDPRRLESLLRPVLNDSWIPDDPDANSSKKSKSVLRRHGTFVAALDQDRKFRSLIDRQALLEMLASCFATANDRESQTVVSQQPEAST